MAFRDAAWPIYGYTAPPRDTDEVIITAAMLDAGLEAFHATDLRYSTPESLVGWVYEAMVKAARR